MSRCTLCAACLEACPQYAEERDFVGAAALQRHTARGKMFVRDRIATLLDPQTPFLEFSALAANGMYKDEAPGAGIVSTSITGGSRQSLPSIRLQKKLDCNRLSKFGRQYQ